jgi:multiple sugar transport system substrate-binding protein
VKKVVHLLVGAALSAVLSSPAIAQKTEIQVWHSLVGEHRSEFEALVARFNREQSAVAVDLTRFADSARLQLAAQEAVAGKRAKPDLLQLPDTHAPEAIAQHKDILPLYQLLQRHPISDASWFLAKTTDFVRDNKGRLLAFPFMAEIPVMYYNLESYRKAGLDDKKPASTWPELQAHLLDLRNNARITCPYATAQQVNVHLENLAPINNKLFITPDNGLKGSKNLSLNFDTLYVRHLSLMVSWQKTELFTKSSAGNEVVDAFTSGECAVLTAGSSALAKLRSSNVRFGVAPLPFYPQATNERGAPFITGDALWVVAGQSPQRNKGTADFLAFLSKPVIAAQWHQRTGFLPLTDAAFRAADVSFYNRIPGARTIVEQMTTAKPQSSAGFRAPHYLRVKPILNTALDEALAAKKSPMDALIGAKNEAQKIMR